MTRRLVVLLPLLLAAAPGAAQQAEPPRLEPVVVTVTRIEQRADEAPASVTVVTREDVRQSAAQTVDDLLRQVPGFSLFRHSSRAIVRIENDKVVEEWGGLDVADVLSQLGAL